ncbi:MAG TPA: hypothetical protein VHK68_01310 [Gemmatimonadales bacterium]|jgi:hypothetical protein|nr:hypothetical protein [Gemmatimonadales bacterium]
MSYDRTLRWSAFGFGIFFALVVALGYIPSLNQGMDHVSMQAPGEHQMMGLYMIGAADDVTHGLTALVFLLAALLSASLSRLALLAFGWYYAIDASIYLITGVVQHKPVLSNILLNLPHVVLSAIMLSLAYHRPRVAGAPVL